jgi:16S rRNA G1207 methylase RsmC
VGDRNGHYFSDEPTSASRPREYVFEGPAGPITVTSDSGVFSHGRLDKATALLIRNPQVAALLPGTGDLVDLGCGAGPIALWLAASRPHCTVWAVDTNERALALTASNARRNNLANVRVVRPQDVPDDLRPTAVVSNPPVRVGKESLHAMLRQWMARLNGGAVAVIVIGRHLGADSLQAWLTSEGWPTERLGSSGGFRLLVARVRSAAD